MVHSFKSRSNRGNKGYRYGKKPPRGAGFRTGVAFDKNNLVSVATMKKRRQGFNLIWRLDPRYAGKIKLKRKGEYSTFTNKREFKQIELSVKAWLKLIRVMVV